MDSSDPKLSETGLRSTGAFLVVSQLLGDHLDRHLTVIGAYSRVGLRLPSRHGFFSRTSKKVKNILKIPTKSAKCVHHNKGVYGERSETRSEKKKKKKKKKREKKQIFCKFVGSNRRPPGVNQTPRAVQ